MGWEDVNQFDLQRLSLDTGTSLDDLEKISDPNEIMEYSKLMFRAREIRDYEAKLLLPFRTLNSKGQSEAIKRVTELTNLPEYCDWIDTQPIVDKVISTRNQDNSIEPIAAHNDNADDEEQIKLIRKDIERIKGMRKK
ncbi:hypothetical protein SDC9_155277 [bioreactor metagenome]|uniref:Uncharacterized protein n=1 Tax=bioreactor metagenome TaxID=1076179 RepID=A0A645F145_9ZZZZ